MEGSSAMARGFDPRRVSASAPLPRRTPAVRSRCRNGRARLLLYLCLKDNEDNAPGCTTSMNFPT
jgi:hypothetical protein